MYAKLGYLFDPSKYDRIKTPDQTEFEKSNLGIMLAMEDAVMKAHQDFETKIRPHFLDGEMDKMMPAISMISFIRQYFIKNFPRYCRAATRSRFRLITDTGEYVYLKKLNRKKRPSNIETHANNMIIYQVTDNKNDKYPHIFFGYTRTRNYARVTGVFAVCIKGKELLWATNITSLKVSMGGIVTTPTSPNIPVLKPDTVKLKKRKDDKKE